MIVVFWVDLCVLLLCESLVLGLFKFWGLHFHFMMFITSFKLLSLSFGMSRMLSDHPRIQWYKCPGWKKFGRHCGRQGRLAMHLS